MHSNAQFWDVCKQIAYEIDAPCCECAFQISAYGKGAAKTVPVKYALVISLENASGTVDVASEIESEGYYPALVSVDSHVGVTAPIDTAASIDATNPN